MISKDTAYKLTLAGCKILRREPLSKYCSFRIGGPADFFIEIPNEQALFVFFKNVPANYIVLGSGTNVLFPDKGYNGIVLRLTGDFKKISVLEDEISSGSAALLSNVLQVALKNDLIGLECAAGIPGTVGGAVYGNTGSRDKWVSAVVKSVEVYENLKKELINKEKMDFNYRKSGFTDCVITRVNFSLKKDTKNGSLKEVSKNIQKRLKTQPLNIPNAGSIFKNPDGFSTGKLIEEAGLKGKRAGGAQISQMHGNFIVNTGGAFSEDILTLINLMKEKVKEKFNITLETEVKIIE
ncbi:MAG: UDP-N-acetylmuramate dehydrogenase [Endomicrobium sp.]|nr:UDP-N-acetylmuramate dehydrogenase [Endomicrobium sp.]